MTTSHPGLPNRKQIRLDGEVYRNVGLACSISAATKDRTPVFAEEGLAYRAVQVLREHSERTIVPVYTYCIMPEHVHLLISPSATTDIPSFVGQFKSLVQRQAWEMGYEGLVWQKRFWDHFLRKDEDLRTAAEYILNNPVRRGLALEWPRYPFSGSLVFEL